MAQAASGFAVNPLQTAPAARYTSDPLSQRTQLDSDPDPRVQHLGAWLRGTMARVTEQERGQPLRPADLALVNRQQAVAKLREATGGDLQIQFRPQNGTAMFIKGSLQRRATGAAKAGLGGDPDEQTARAFLRANRDLFQIEDPDQEFILSHTDRDELQRRHLRFSQFYRGLPVWPCELVVHLDSNGNVNLVNGTSIPTPSGTPVTPSVLREHVREAVLLVLPQADPDGMTEPELIVYGPLDRSPRLGWKLEVTAGPTVIWRIVLDAMDGSLLSRSSLVKEAALTGSGADGRGLSRSINLWQDGNTYYMVDTSKQMFDPNSRPPHNARGAILIYDAANRQVQDPQFSAGLISSTTLDSGWDPDAVGAAYGLSETYDYYLERFGRDSLDGRGGSIRAIVRFGQDVANAFWYGTTKTMVFGFGFTREIDISGHELTHGVIDSVGNGGILEYQNQPGALNEALADIFGEMVEARNKGTAPDWLKSDPFEPGNRDKLIQDYANPTSVSQLGGPPNPSKMSEFVNLSIQQDNGGVHINSSIINHCFYQLAQGMPQALGLGDAERIFYRAMTTYLQKQSQFIDMRLACVTSAEDVFGADSPQAQRTRQAFDLVEIVDAPSTPDPTPIPEISAPDSTLFLRYEPFFDGVVMGRREQALGDGPDGVLLDTFDFVAPRRISVSGDGSYAAFVTDFLDIGIISTDGSELDFADLAGSVHSVAMAPDGLRFAVVLINPFTGQPDKEIIIVDLRDSTVQRIGLLAPVADGPPQDIVQWADAMDFLPSSNVLIYDAVSEIPLSGGGSFTGWTLFAVDLGTESISTIINLNEGLDFGNPSLGNVRTHLLTHEVIDRTSNIATIYAVDLRSGDAKQIATLAQQNVLGFPAYTGDDRAIIYTQVDLSVPTTVSLFRQEVAADGITPVGQPTLWLADADYAAIYRRGDFVPTNALPQVSLTSPTPGQTFPVPASITVTANAMDSDGSVERVQFFVGSSMIAETATAPYSTSFTVEEAPSGMLRLTARAIDNLGGASDSAPIEVNVGGSTSTPITITAQPQSQTVAAGAKATFRVAAHGGSGPLTYRWRRNGVDLGATGPVLELQNVPVGAAGEYSVIISDGVESVTSAAATLTVTGGAVNGIRVQAKRLAGGLVQLTISGGDIEDRLEVQSSPDLKTWTTLSTLVKTGESVSFVDTESSGAAMRFYRVRVRN